MVATAGGCLVSSSTTEKRSGNFVPESTFSRLAIGTSTASFVEAMLGAHTSKTTVDDVSEIWRCTYTESKSGSGAVFLIFGGSSEKTVERSAFVQIKNNFKQKARRT